MENLKKTKEANIMTPYEKETSDKNAMFREAFNTVDSCFHGKVLIPVRDVAAVMGISFPTIKAVLPTKKVGGRYYVTRFSLASWLSKEGI